jgi:alkanesulfonate monooxygenase SsuD/methylene tetrahydromethanopterin reductase-like flavin-dependent oxidoreductase (luciferase family)
MRLGISLPYERPDGGAPTAAQLAARARLIEAVGFDVIAQGDHVGARTRPTPDVLTWLTAAAAATTRVELASAVIQVPLRHPAELAHRLVNVNAVSGGRFVAGLGAGSTPSDYNTVGVPFDSRFRFLADALPVIRSLCRGEPSGDAVFHPWADQPPGPPILIGAWASGRWVRRAAEDFDGWMASGHSSFREIAEGIKVFRDRGGKRAMLVSVTVDLHKRERVTADEVFRLNCEPAEAAEWLARIADLGYDDACLVRIGHTEADLTEEDLRTIRALVPCQKSEVS